MFEDRTTENLKKEVLEAIRPEAGVSTLAGSYADAVAGPLCQMVSNLYKALPAVTSMLFIDESSGRFIDLVAQDYHDLTRRAGTRARCTVTLTGKAGTAIPAGTVFLTGTGLQFLLLESVAIGSGGSAVGRLEAAEAGSAYNIASGTLSRMYVNINGLERYVNGQAEGGTDRESDAALYQRVDEARTQPATSGNGWDDRRWAMEADGVGEVKVVELWDGPGTVGLTLVDSNFEGASQEIVEAVAANIQVKRPPGADDTVSAAKEAEIRISASVVLSGASAGTVQTELESRLRGYLRQLIQTKYQTIYYGPGQDLPYTLLYNRVLALLLSIDGVENFSSLTVNGDTKDITVPVDSVPVLKEVHVT